MLQKQSIDSSCARSHLFPLVTTLLGIHLMACQAKITANSNPITPNATKPPIDIEGTWASSCVGNTMFGYSEITVLQFNDFRVKYTNYRYSDAQCTTQSFLDQKNGEINFIQQNTDLSYNIEYLMEIGQGVKQIFFDIIAREGENLYFGDYMAGGEEQRSKSVNHNRPFARVADGYVPPAHTPPITPPSTDSTFLGEVDLKMSSNTFEASNPTTDSAYKYYRYSQDHKQNLYISSIGGGDSCNAEPKKQFQWIEVLDNGSLGSPQNISMGTSFTAEANKKYILKLSLSGLTSCYVSYSFDLSMENTNP